MLATLWESVADARGNRKAGKERRYAPYARVALIAPQIGKESITDVNESDPVAIKIAIWELASFHNSVEIPRHTPL